MPCNLSAEQVDAFAKLLLSLPNEPPKPPPVKEVRELEAASHG